jgi:hypothetical protein
MRTVNLFYKKEKSIVVVSSFFHECRSCCSKNAKKHFSRVDFFGKRAFQKMNSRLRRNSWLWCLSLGLALSTLAVDAAPIDSDCDGLSDEQEISLGFDPHSVDSNMDGIADLDAYRSMSRSALVSRQDAPAGPTGDADGDGIRDFLETYGYYDQDHTLVGLRRIVPDASWDNFVSSIPPAQDGIAVNVYQLAAAALKSSLLAQHSDTYHAYIVDVAAAYPVIRNAFINAGVPENSALITGSTTQAGSIAAIMSFLVTKHDYLVPTDSSGKARPIYFTHPLRASTDDDPYTDYDEALGIFNGGRPAAPADHPLVAALPSIRARLVSYRLTEISASSTTLGSSETHTDVVRNTVSVGQSNGFAVGITHELEVGPSGPSVKGGITVTQSNSWSSGTSVATEDRNAHGTFAQRTDSASNNCFAKLGLTVRLENVGSALASNVSTSLNISLGNTLWRTVPVTTSASGLTLQPNGSRTLTVLGQGTEDGCLTLNETNYLEQGGVIGIDTALGDATISIYDPDKRLVVQDGSWAVYKALIENELARIDLNVTTTAGNNLVQSFWVVAAQNGYPGLSLSVEEVLGRIYQRFACEDQGITALACFKAGTLGDIALTGHAGIDFTFFNESGELMSRLQSSELYKALPGDKPLSKKLAARTVASIVERSFDIPQFSHLDVVTRLDPQVGSGTPPDALVRALVRDFFGVARVDFCRNANASSCTPMTSTLGTAAAPFSGQYEIRLPRYTFSGTEYLKAVSVSERTAQQTPEAFFMTLGDDLYRTLDEYAQRMAEKIGFSEKIAKLRADQRTRFNALVAAGLVVTPEAADLAIEKWNTALTAAKNACSYNVSTQATAQQLAAQVTTCLNAIRTGLVTAFKEDVRAYDLTKLPHELLGATEQQWMGDALNLDTPTTLCKLKPGQVMVGLDMGKLAAGNTPTAWVRYRAYNALTETLSAVSEMHCGPAQVGREKQFSTPATQAPVESHPWVANVILDVGASIGDSSGTGVNNGDIERLCVRYRAFDFKNAIFRGNVFVNCNGSVVASVPATEANTGLEVANVDKALYALKIGGTNNGTLRYMRGLHVSLSQEYRFRPLHLLVSGGRYLIKNNAGEALAVRGSAASSRELITTPATGNAVDPAAMIWKVEAVNDREFRLIPEIYNGFITDAGYGSSSKPSVVASVATDADNTAANYAQHWRLTRLVNGFYLIQSALGGRLLSSNLTPVPASTALEPDQQWSFIRQDAASAKGPTVDEVTLWWTGLPGSPTNIPRNSYECWSVNAKDADGTVRYISRIELVAARDPAYTDFDSFYSFASVYLDLEGDSTAQRRRDFSIPLFLSGKRFEWNLDQYLPVSRIRICGDQPDTEQGHVPNHSVVLLPNSLKVDMVQKN